MVKTSGKEFKAFYTDTSFWPEGNWHEDEELMVDGAPAAAHLDFMTIQDSSILLLTGGAIFSADGKDCDLSMETLFKRWRKHQSHETVMVEVKKELADAVRAAVLAAGGKIV